MTNATQGLKRGRLPPTSAPPSLAFATGRHFWPGPRLGCRICARRCKVFSTLSWLSLFSSYHR